MTLFAFLGKVYTYSNPDVLLNQIAGFKRSDASVLVSQPFAVEASWVTGKWDKLKDYMSETTIENTGDFNVGVAGALIALYDKKHDEFRARLAKLRKDAARSLSTTIISSLQTCHDTMLKFHVLTEIEAISGIEQTDSTRATLAESLQKRLDVLGAFSSDKQYLLGLRRAAMQASRYDRHH